MPTHSVVLLSLLPNHPFSNLDFSGLDQPILLNFDFAVSKCSRFNNWPIFSKSITDLVHFRPYQTLCYFVAFWVLLASTKWPLHFGMVLSHCLEESKLPYLIWKGIFRAFIWSHLLKYLLVKKPSSGHFIRLSLGALVDQITKVDDLWSSRSLIYDRQCYVRDPLPPPSADII